MKSESWNAAAPPLTSAVAAGGVTKVAAAADATVGPLAVVQAPPALARPPVASVRVRHVDVVVAAARLAAAAGLRGVAIVTWSALLTASTCSRRRSRTEVRGHCTQTGLETGESPVLSGSFVEMMPKILSKAGNKHCHSLLKDQSVLSGSLLLDI